jgi:hypothetical protein
VKQYILLLFLSTSLSAEGLCVFGDGVRLRSTMSPGAKVVREFFLGDYLGEAGRIDSTTENGFMVESVGSEIELGGQRGKWMKVKRSGCANACVAETGFIFGAYVRPCSESAAKLKRILLDGTKPLPERLLYRTLRFRPYGPTDSPEPAAKSRLLPGGKSTERDLICPLDTGCMATAFDWTAVNGQLRISVTTGDLRSNGTMRYECAFTGIREVVTDLQTRFILEPAKPDGRCRVEVE